MIVVGKYVDKKGKEKTIKIQLRFIDSFKFMASSLDKLVKNMEKEDLKIIKKEYEGEKLNREMPPVNGINGQKITERTSFSMQLKWRTTHGISPTQ